MPKPIRLVDAARDELLAEVAKYGTGFIRAVRAALIAPVPHAIRIGGSAGETDRDRLVRVACCALLMRSDPPARASGETPIPAAKIEDGKPFPAVRRVPSSSMLGFGSLIVVIATVMLLAYDVLAEGLACLGVGIGSVLLGLRGTKPRPVSTRIRVPSHSTPGAMGFVILGIVVLLAIGVGAALSDLASWDLKH